MNGIGPTKMNKLTYAQTLFIFIASEPGCASRLYLPLAWVILLMVLKDEDMKPVHDGIPNASK